MDGAFNSAAPRSHQTSSIWQKVTLRDDLLGEEIQQNKQKLHSHLIITNIQ
jgi:hypothetical protein